MAAGRRPPSRAPATPVPWLVVTVLAVAGLAWVAMVLLHGYGGSAAMTAVLPPDSREPAAQGRYATGGHALHHAPAADGGAEGVLLWLGGWVIMVLAMMMPPVLPFLRVMARLVADRPAGGPLLLVSASAFVLAWTIAGLMLLAGGGLLSAAIGGIPFIAERPFLPAGAAAVFAGAYQFTPLKKACLAACRSPASIVMTLWRAETPFRAAAEIGLRYGLVCVGCCWALMVLGLVVGALALPVMVATAVIMAAERMLPSVRPLIPLQAGFAGILGLLLLSGLVPPAFVWP
jgi:predicted metal-binding membrane protein